MDTTIMNRWIGVSGERCTTQSEGDAVTLARQLSDALARAEAAERRVELWQKIACEAWENLYRDLRQHAEAAKRERSALTAEVAQLREALEDLLAVALNSCLDESDTCVEQARAALKPAQG